MISDPERANRIIKLLKERLKKELDENAKLKTDYLYLLADFENYKKRTESKIRSSKDEGKAELILRLSDFINELFYYEQAVYQLLGKENEVAKGFTMILQKLIKALSDEGIKILNPLNEPFNPELHQIAYTEKVDNQDMKGKVIKVLSKGYMQNDKVIKPAVVVVGV